MRSLPKVSIKGGRLRTETQQKGVNLLWEHWSTVEQSAGRCIIDKTEDCSKVHNKYVHSILKQGILTCSQTELTSLLKRTSFHSFLQKTPKTILVNFTSVVYSNKDPCVLALHNCMVNIKYVLLKSRYIAHSNYNGVRGENK